MKKIIASTVASLGVLLFSAAAMARPVAVAELSTDNIRRSADLPAARSSHDPIPPAPSPIVGRKLTLVHQAGVGGPTAYARNGVLELGGNLSFNMTNRNEMLTVTPAVGYFITDNVELSVLTTVNHQRADKVRKTNVTAVFEPSLHLPIVDQLFVFGGLGVGAAYHQSRGTGFALAPRVGVEGLVGRSGVVRLAYNVNWSSNSARETLDGDRVIAVHTMQGLSVGYSVMF